MAPGAQSPGRKYLLEPGPKISTRFCSPDSGTRIRESKGDHDTLDSPLATDRRMECPIMALNQKSPPSARERDYLTIAMIPLGVAMNLALGTLVHTLRLPIYVDATGTLIITLLLGWRAGVITGVLSFVLGSLLVNPVLVWFSGTQVAIAMYTHVVGRRGGFRSYARTIAAGIGLGIVAGIVSAPVIVKMFAGVTGSGTSLITAYLIAGGKTILKSVLLSGAASEPLDKTIQALLAVWVLRGMPKTLLARFRGGSLVENGLLDH